MSSNWCLAHTLFGTDISTLDVVVQRNDTLYVELIFGVLCHVLAVGLFVIIRLFNAVSCAAHAIQGVSRL